MTENSGQRNRTRRGGLGRGLESLIPTSPTPVERASGVQEVPLDAIVANPFQPRNVMDQDQLHELADSIRVHGLMQPLIVTMVDTDRYELIAGERRWRASRLAGLNVVPVLVREATPQAKLELALVENVVRADLGPLEEAVAYKQLIDEFGLSQADVAARVGRSRVSITNTLRLLSSPEQVQSAIMTGKISEGHARALLGLPSLADQVEALKLVLARELSVRQTEDLVRTWSRQTDAPKSPKPRRAEDVQVEQRLERALGTRVALKRTANQSGGTVSIQFHDDEQLQDFLTRVAGEEVW